MDLHANLNQLAATDTANSLAFGQRMLHDFYGSAFGDHIGNAAGTALAGLFLFGLFSGLHAVCIPSLSLIEQIGKLVHDHLVQLLRGTSKQFPLLQLQLLHQPTVLQKSLGQLGALSVQLLILLSQFGVLSIQLLALPGQLCLQRFVFRTGNRNHFPVACLVRFCIFHADMIP